MGKLSETLPFKAIVGLPDTLAGADLIVKVRALEPNATLEDTGRLIDNFLTCADSGMFSGDAVSPTRSSIQYHSRYAEAAELRIQCNVRGVDPGAFRVLLTALGQGCNRLEPLAEFSLTGPHPSRDRLSLEDILALPLPARPLEIPFALNLPEDYDEFREPILRMEFHDPLTDEQFDRIRPALDAWDHLLVLGGYRDPSRPDYFAEPAELYLAEPAVLEHVLSVYDFPAEAYHSVIGLAVGLHHRVSPLVAFEID